MRSKWHLQVAIRTAHTLVRLRWRTCRRTNALAVLASCVVRADDTGARVCRRFCFRFSLYCSSLIAFRISTATISTPSLMPPRALSYFSSALRACISCQDAVNAMHCLRPHFDVIANRLTRALSFSAFPYLTLRAS